MSKILTKTLTYRIMSTTVTMGITWLVTGSTAAAGGVGILDAVTKSALYSLHEMLWRS